MTIAWMTFCLDKGVMRHLMAFFFSAAALHAVLAASAAGSISAARR